MSIMTAMTAAAPILLPAVIGAAGGAGIGALTGDGFSDDDWWQGMLAGGLTGGIGGGMGMFSPAGGGLMGGSAIPSKLTAGLSSSPLPAGIPPTGGLDAFMSSIPTQGLSSPITATQGGPLGNFLGSTSGHGINFLGAPSGSLFGGLSEIGRGNLGALNPSQDTLTKGLLGSMVFKNMSPSGQKQQQQGSINRGQRAAPFQPRQPIMIGGGRPQRRSFRR
jgi:hypothetical protein